MNSIDVFVIKGFTQSNTAVIMYKETENINIYLRRIIIDIDIQFCVVI